ncbi:CPBP family intramembrane glutamic endopeptidase [Furfurilactobacillus siliginis]|uniref:CAAX prenyl protease 2/Lysostaphin resistance protein A-like domain-containing protein n=1 Tax=Furfurilactobacillus siliginis TaxID=348151 RepID=A0A0R2LBM4_9LACO|nr:CPBP family intramembrane glutamic endopeptidase [Furfurilactobacillus siliginis]KRN96061.1 hypothetical protein IV55_GL001744 [Furfurilactobacillus siliginis]GEK28767.1 hypothetical protein LSI01_10780 [Furfurilactobacillus siliginis]
MNSNTTVKSFGRVAITTIILSLVWTSLSRLANPVVSATYGTFFKSGSTAFWHVAVPMAITYAIFMSYMAHEKRIGQIYQPQPKLERTWVRIVFGIVTVVMIVFSLYNLYFRMTGVLNHWNSASLGRILVICLAIILVAITEESVFRGFVLTEMRRSHSELQAMLLATVLFGLWHFPNIINGSPLVQVSLQVITTMLIGSGIYMSMRFTRSIYGAMAIHWLWDFALVIAIV